MFIMLRERGRPGATITRLSSVRIVPSRHHTLWPAAVLQREFSFGGTVLGAGSSGERERNYLTRDACEGIQHHTLLQQQRNSILIRFT